MSKNQIFVSVVALCVVAAIVFFAVQYKPQSSSNLEFDENAITESGMNIATGDGYSASIPKGATVSEFQNEVPLAPNRNEQLRISEMRVSARGYEPSSLVMKKGDVMYFTLTAVDGDYDFHIPANNIYAFVKRGETKQISFGLTTTGTFAFQCRDHCPQGKIIQGSIVALP